MKLLYTLTFSLALLGGIFPTFSQSSSIVSNWKKKYAKFQEVGEWSKNYKGPWTSWFGGDNKELADTWFLYFGPLGIRVYAHDSTWGNMPAFKARYPELLTNTEGDLIINAFEVLHVAPGSPADGHLKEGDLILEMNGKTFQASSSLRFPDGPYQFQEERSLEMHAGMLLDEAEATGKVNLKIVRPSDITTPPTKPASQWKTVAEADLKSKESKQKGFEVNIPVKQGELFRLVVTDGGNGNGNDGFDWEGLVLQNSTGKSVPLYELLPLNYRTGWGGRKVDKEKNTWWAHAPSEILVQVPEGNWTLKGKGIHSPGSSTTAQVDICPAQALPAGLEAKAKRVSLTIPAIGSYAKDGFGSKSRKVQNVVEMTGAWLAAQQNEDGSWSRHGGYTKSHYDTGVAGLGLMATGNPAYDKNIRKAAEFIAFSGTKDWWGVPLSTATIFLCEYWLRYKDDRVLPAISNSANRLINEMLYGDYVSGHGIHPGYRGTGVSVGGSHMALALALAAKTPVKFERSVIDKMLVRAQEIAPSGFVPYGRTAENLNLEPSLENGATYSGRNAPYLIASYLHGGPQGFTKNCSALYSYGKLGGADQGHSTETLTLLWTFPASVSINPQTYYRQINSFIWKLTMIRTFDGGFCWNANRTEYQGAESLLNLYIRTGAWLLALCADKQNLAITGNPIYKAKTFKNVPLVSDPDARVLGAYKRNWAIAIAALGKKAPDTLKQTYKKLTAIPAKPGCRDTLFSLLQTSSLPLAKQILEIPNTDPVLLAYCAEIILGVDTRISFDIKREDDKDVPGNYNLQVTVQQPFSGRSLGLRGEQEKEAKKPLLPFTAEISFEDPGKAFKDLEKFQVDASKDNFNNWNAIEKKVELAADKSTDEQIPLTALISYKIGDLSLSYKRPIIVNKEEPGNGEKGRKIVNDRLLLVPGILARDHGNWGISFYLPDKTFISAASQGNIVTVHEGKGQETKSWLSPNDRSLTADSKARFLCSTGWDGLELRIGDIYLLQQGAPMAKIRQISANGKELDIKDLQDSASDTSAEIESDSTGKLELLVTLNSPTPVRAVDIRAADGPGDMKAVISCENIRKWHDVYWTTFLRNGHSIFDFQPTRTSKLKITLTRKSQFKMKLSELIVYQALPPKKEESKETPSPARKTTSPSPQKAL